MGRIVDADNPPALRAAVQEVGLTAPLLGLGLAGCPWWQIIIVGAVTVFFHGAAPALRWLDVLDRLDARKPAEQSRNAAPLDDRAVDALPRRLNR